MSNMLADGLSWLTDQLAANASWPATYARGYDSVDVSIIPGEQLLKLDDGFGGIRMEWTDLDACIPVRGFTFSADPITPQRGDLLHLTRGDEVKTFEVLPFGNEPTHRLIHLGSAWRIHLKLIDVEAFYG